MSWIHLTTCLHQQATGAEAGTSDSFTFRTQLWRVSNLILHRGMARSLFLWPQVPRSCSFSSTSLIYLLIVWGGRNWAMWKHPRYYEFLLHRASGGQAWKLVFWFWSSWNMASSRVKAGIPSFWGDTNKMSSGGAPISFHDVHSAPRPTPGQAHCEAWDWLGTNSNKFLRQRRS